MIIDFFDVVAGKPINKNLFRTNSFNLHARHEVSSFDSVFLGSVFYHQKFHHAFFRAIFHFEFERKLMDYHELKVHIYQSSFIKQKNIEMKMLFVYFELFCLISKEC